VRHPIVLTVQDDTMLDFSAHHRLQGVGRVGDDHGTGFLAHSCLAVLPFWRGAGPRPPDDLVATAQGLEAADPGVGGLGRNGRSGRPSADEKS
jgi:hypothetical protein